MAFSVCCVNADDVPTFFTSSWRLFQSQVLCSRQATKGGQLEGLLSAVFHPATAVGVCLPLDPLAHKGLKRQRRQSEHTPATLSLALDFFTYTHGGACARTKRIRPLQMSAKWTKSTSHLNLQIINEFTVWLTLDKSKLQMLFAFFSTSDCEKTEPTRVCIGKVDIKSYDCVRWPQHSQSP